MAAFKSGASLGCQHRRVNRSVTIGYARAVNMRGRYSRCQPSPTSACSMKIRVERPRFDSAVASRPSPGKLLIGAQLRDFLRAGVIAQNYTTGGMLPNESLARQPADRPTLPALTRERRRVLCRRYKRRIEFRQGSSFSSAAGWEAAASWGERAITWS